MGGRDERTGGGFKDARCQSSPRERQEKRKGEAEERKSPPKTYSGLPIPYFTRRESSRMPLEEMQQNLKVQRKHPPKPSHSL